MRDWNDFQLVLALARSNSLQKAALALKVNHSTAYRRLNALEARIGVALFERSASGYISTEAGERMVLAAERIEAEALALDREVSGGDDRLTGSLRVTMSETLAFGLVTDLLATFRVRHPGIRVEVSIDNRELDLSRREADVALRATRPAQSSLFGTKIADIAWSVYGSHGFLSDRDPLADFGDLARHPVIGWESDARVKAARWLAEMVPADAIVYATNSLINQLTAAKAGIGFAVLPCYIGDRAAELRRAIPEAVVLSRELWLVTHDDLRRAARVRAFFDLVGTGLMRFSALLEGRMRDSADSPAEGQPSMPSG